MAEQQAPAAAIGTDLPLCGVRILDRVARAPPRLGAALARHGIAPPGEAAGNAAEIAATVAACVA